jgi:hypothetical protein
MRILSGPLPLALAIVLFIGSALIAQPPERRPLDETRSEELVEIHFDRSIFPATLEAIEEIVRSEDVSGAAVREVSGKTANFQVWGRTSELSHTQGWNVEGSDANYWRYWARAAGTNLPSIQGRQYLRIQVGILSPYGSEEGKQTEKFARLVIERLNKVLAELSRREYERRLKELNIAAAQARQAVDHASAKLNDTRVQHRGESSLSIPVLEELASNLKKQQQALEVDLAGMKGRKEALQVEIAKTAERVKKEPADDEVVRNLQRVLDLRVQHLRNIKKIVETGTVTELEAGKAEEAVAMAQVELAQAKRTISRSATDQLDKLNSDLALIAVNSAELESKLKYVTEQLEINIVMLREGREAEPIRERIARETKAVESLRLKAEQVDTNVRQLESSFRPARIEVFDLDDSEGAKEQNGAEKKKDS